MLENQVLLGREFLQDREHGSHEEHEAREETGVPAREGVKYVDHGIFLAVESVKVVPESGDANRVEAEIF